MLEMEDILKLESINRGGIRRVEIIFESDIVEAPTTSPASLFAEGSMSIAIGSRPYFLYFTHKSSLFEERGNISNAAGDYSTQSIKFKSPKDRPLLRDFISRLENSEFAVVYLDWNGYWKILRRMRAVVNVTSNNFGGYNGANFTFTSKSQERAQFWYWAENPYVYVNPETNEITPVGQIGPDNTTTTNTETNTGNGGGTGSGGDSGSGDACVSGFTHSQDIAALKWTIEHNLGKDTHRPRLKNAAGFDLEAEGLVQRIWYKDENTIEVDFTSAQSGSAFITGFGDCLGDASSSANCCCDGERVDFNNFYEITLPAEKKLTSIDIWSTLNKTIKVGTTNGGEDIAEAEMITAFVPLSLDIGLFSLTEKRIFVSGAGAFKMKYYIAGCTDGEDSCCEGTKETGTDSIAIIIPAEKKLTSIEFWADADVLVSVGNSVSSFDEVEDAEFEFIEGVLSLELGIFTLQEKIIYVSAPGDFTIKYYLK